jgi:hypothetical protein
VRPRKESIALLAVVVIATLAWTAGAQNQKRTVRGQVLDEKGDAVVGAIVNLKNKQTDETLTVTAGSEGRYQFNNVDMKTDFKLYAEFEGRKSQERTISQFDTRTTAVYNLRLESAKDQETKAKEKEKAEKD